MEFELAAIYRDQLRAVTAVREEQRVVSVKDVDQDVIGLYREASLAEVLVLEVRAGRVSDSVSYSLRGVELPDEEVLSGFLTEYYGSSDRGLSVIPDEILVPLLPDGAEGVAEWLGELRAKKVSIHVPQRGPKVELLALASENAAHAFREKQRKHDDLDSRLDEIQQRLRLPAPPHRIECCDISHLGGGDTVGSIVSLLDGQPDRKHYRSYHVKSVADGDDYGAMYEVLARRFRRGKAARAEALSAAQAASEAAAGVAEAPEVEELEAGPESGEQGEAPIAREHATEVAQASEAPTPIERAAARTDGEWDLPDLLVVDGGRGQLGVALSAARDLGLHDLPIVGLAKEKENASGEKLVDRVYLPGQKNGIPLRSQSSSLFFLSRARDEAHRFANHIRKRLGKAKRLRSEIEDIPGLGAAAKKALLRELGSMEAIRKAADAQILAVPGLSKRHLTALRKVIRAPEPPDEPGS
jgi:excinuclease ABC subunit C